MRSHRGLGVALVVAALIAAACSGNGNTETPTTTATTVALTSLAPVETTTTTAAPTTTTIAVSTTTSTVPVDAETSPLNGLVVPAPQEPELERRVVAVKIDNHPLARPQSGIQGAQAVYELLVEGGLTRFIALFHHTDSAYVGPIRSARPTDPTLLTFLGAPLQISGGQSWVISRFRNAGVPVISDDQISTYRVSDRSGPHNLYGNTTVMRTTADRRGYSDVAPETFFEFGDTTATTAATEITLDWSDHPEVRWVWDGDEYMRYNSNTPHNWRTIDGRIGQITTDTLLVLNAQRYTATPGPGQNGKPVPALETVGTGDALAFFDGKALEAIWKRETIEDPFELMLPSGATAMLPPGKLWISVFPTSSTLTWE